LYSEWTHFLGTLPARATIYNKTRKVQEKVPKILQVNADDYIEMDQVKAGDIAVLVGLKSTCTGDTLVLQPNAFPQWFKLDPIPIPPAVFMCSIEPCTRSDESTMEKALTALQKEDPSLHIIRDEETGQTLLGGMGELHLEIALDRLQKNFKVNLNGGQVKIAYREGLVSEILASRYTYDHKILDMKRFAEIEMSMEPLEPIQEFLPSATQNHIHVLPQVKQDLTGVIPSSELTQALQAIHQGVEQGLYRGPLRQYPLTNMNVTVHSVKGVPGQTLIPVLKVAAIQAVQQLLRQHQDKVILWEPLMDVSLQVPTHALGSVTKSINSTMRGHVLSMDLEPISQRHMIQANIPLKALIGFSSHLRSLTKGAGNFAMSLKEYSPVSADQLKDISRA
jgi:elongation factor G